MADLERWRGRVHRRHDPTLEQTVQEPQADINAPRQIVRPLCRLQRQTGAQADLAIAALISGPPQYPPARPK